MSKIFSLVHVRMLSVLMNLFIKDIWIHEFLQKADKVFVFSQATMSVYSVSIVSGYGLDDRDFITGRHKGLFL
jgi:hypothetical protein